MSDPALHPRSPRPRGDRSRLVSYAFLLYCVLTPALFAATPAVLIAGTDLSLPAALKTSVIVVGAVYVVGLTALFGRP